MDNQKCGVCGATGARCRFATACSCWRGVRCDRATMSPFVRRALARELPAKELGR